MSSKTIVVKSSIGIVQTEDNVKRILHTMYNGMNNELIEGIENGGDFPIVVEVVGDDDLERSLEVYVSGLIRFSTDFNEGTIWSESYLMFISYERIVDFKVNKL